VFMRGLRAGRDPGSRRCPECGRDMRGVEGRRCAGCEFEVRREEELLQFRSDPVLVRLGAAAFGLGIVLVPLGIWVWSWETDLSARGPWVRPLSAALAGVGTFGAALAVWAWRGDRSRGRRRCPKCWYDMSAAGKGSAGLVCPECGHDAGSVRRLYLPRRRRRLVWNGALLVVVGIYGQNLPRALRVGPMGLVPTTVLVAGMNWLPETWYPASPRGSEETLQDRINGAHLWDWQVAWARHRARSAVTPRLSRSRASVIASMLDSESVQDRAQVIVGMARLLGEADSPLGAASASELERGYSGLLWLWEAPARSAEGQRIRLVVGSVVAQLVERIEAGSAPEARLCMQLLRNAGLYPAEAVQAVVNRLRRHERGSADRIAWYLAGAMSESDALDGVAAIAATGDPQVRSVAIQALGWAGTEASCEALLRIALSDSEPAAVRLASAAIAGAGGSGHGAVRQLISDQDLRTDIRRGLADGWSKTYQAIPAEQLAVLLPLLDATSRAADLDRVLSVLLYSRDAPGFPVDEVVRRVQPLLSHADASVCSDAINLLEWLGVQYPEWEPAILAMLQTASSSGSGAPDAEPGDW